jgi:hypothetical protein
LGILILKPENVNNQKTSLKNTVDAAYCTQMKFDKIKRLIPLNIAPCTKNRFSAAVKMQKEYHFLLLFVS